MVAWCRFSGLSLRMAIDFCRNACSPGASVGICSGSRDAESLGPLPPCSAGPPGLPGSAPASASAIGLTTAVDDPSMSCWTCTGAALRQPWRGARASGAVAPTRAVRAPAAPSMSR